MHNKDRVKKKKRRMTGIIGGECTVQHWYQQCPAGTNVHADNGDKLKIGSVSKLFITYIFYFI